MTPASASSAFAFSGSYVNGWNVRGKPGRSFGNGAPNVNAVSPVTFDSASRSVA